MDASDPNCDALLSALTITMFFMAAFRFPFFQACRRRLAFPRGGYGVSLPLRSYDFVRDVIPQGGTRISIRPGAHGFYEIRGRLPPPIRALSFKLEKNAS